MQIRLNERKEGAECLMSNGGRVQMEGGRNDPLVFSVPTAWRLAGGSLGVPSGKEGQGLVSAEKAQDGLAYR